MLQASVFGVVEFTSFTLDLKVNKTLFPPKIQYTTFWKYDGEIILNIPGIETGSYNITIDSVPRSYSGKLFELSIPDTMQSVNFTLNVLCELVYSYTVTNHQIIIIIALIIIIDPPKAELNGVSTIVYSSVGDEVILTGATDITGNPFPAGVWRINGSDIPIVLSGRYLSETTGKLFITNVSVEDFGNYVFTASNGVGVDLTSEIISLLEIGKKVASLFQCHNLA